MRQPRRLPPLAAVARKARYLARGDRTDSPETHFGDHAFETATRHGAGCGTTQILINDLDLRKSQISQARLHRILQLPTLEVVRHLKRRGLH